MDTPRRLQRSNSGSRVRSQRDLKKLAPLNEVSASAQAVKGSWAVLWNRESSFHDRFTALRMLLFLTFEDPMSSVVAWWVSLVLLVAILVNSVAFIAGSLRRNQVQPKHCKFPVCIPGEGQPCPELVCHPEENVALWDVEFITIIMFTVDYLIRMLTVHAVPVELINPRSIDYTVDGRLKDRSAKLERGGFSKTFHYFFRALNVIDLISILPFYIHMIYVQTDVASQDLSVLRVLRLLRVIRIFKLGRYSEGGMLLARTLKASLPALVLFIFLTTIITIIFGSLMYFFETGHFTVTPEYPHGAFLRYNARGTAKELSPFTSILMGMYWVVVNTTTLGNCALFPTTLLGRVTSCIVAYCGILSLALPISIVGKNFTEQYNMVYGKNGGCFEGSMSGNNTPLSLTRQSSASSRRLVRDVTRAKSFRSSAADDIEKESIFAAARSGGSSPALGHSTSFSGHFAQAPAPRPVSDTKLVIDDPSCPPLLVAELQSSLQRLESEVEVLRAQLRALEARSTGGVTAAAAPSTTPTTTTTNNNNNNNHPAVEALQQTNTGSTASTSTISTEHRQ